MFGAGACAEHDRLAAPASPGSHGGGSSHAAHGTHQAASTGESSPGDHKACTCIDQCGACQVFTMVVAAQAPAADRIVLTSRIAAPRAHLPARVAYQLPLATAPPAIA